MSGPMPELKDLVKVRSGVACKFGGFMCAFHDYACSHIQCARPNVMFLTKENYTRWLTVKLTKA